MAGFGVCIKKKRTRYLLKVVLRSLRLWYEQLIIPLIEKGMVTMEWMRGRG